MKYKTNQVCLGCYVVGIIFKIFMRYHKLASTKDPENWSITSMCIIQSDGCDLNIQHSVRPPWGLRRGVSPASPGGGIKGQRRKPSPFLAYAEAQGASGILRTGLTLQRGSGAVDQF